tara:strand:+ start:476 stop:892 length:417 start_codon:yes stop_codon:yes gene_type:complete
MVKFEEVYKNLTGRIEKLESFELNAHNLIKLLRITIEIVETLELPGKDKKLLVIDLLKKYTTESSINEAEKNICLEMINNGTLSETIDLVIDASNGDLDINNVIDLGKSCCAILLRLILQRKEKKKRKKRVKLLVKSN